MSPDMIVATWERLHPESPPAGYMIRQAEATKSIRFHSMVGTKRTPQTDVEEQMVLGRLNTIADTVFRKGELVAAVITEFQLDTPIRPVHWGFTQIKDPPKLWIELLEKYVDTATASFWAGNRTWASGCADALLLAAALDRAGAVTLFSVDRGDTFCPYDGGVDIFLSDISARHALEERFRDWLP